MDTLFSPSFFRLDDFGPVGSGTEPPKKDGADSSVMRTFYDSNSLFNSWNSLHSATDFSRDKLVMSETAASDAISALQQESVAQSLPFEILRTIFMFTMTFASPPFPFQSVFHKYFLSPSNRREPISLTHVCALWRVVALSVPELWLAVSASPESTGRTTPGVLRIWMSHISDVLESRQKQKRIGLDLQFALPRIARTHDPREIKHMKEVIPIVWENVPWCRSLNLCLDRNALSQSFDILAQGDFGPEAPFLEDLELMFTSNVSDCDVELGVICAWMDSLPSLRRAKLQFMQIYDHFSLLFQVLPLPKLQEVIICAEMSFENSLLLLSQCTAAEALTITKMGWPIPSPARLSDLLLQPTVTLPHLTSLSLADSVGPSVLLRFLHLPSLTRLTIRKSRPSLLEDSILSLEGFLARSKCPLDLLKVSDPHMPHSSAIALLRMHTVRKVKNVDLCYQGSGGFLKSNFYGVGPALPLPQGIRKLMAWRSFSDSHDHIGWKGTLEPQEILLYWIEGGSLHEIPKIRKVA